MIAQSLISSHEEEAAAEGFGVADAIEERAGKDFGIKHRERSRKIDGTET